MEMSKKEIAELFKVSPDTVTSWVKKGMKGMRGKAANTKYEMDEALPWILEEVYIKPALANRKDHSSTKTIDKEILDAELVSWKVEKEKHAVLKDLGVTISFDKAEELLNHRLTQVKNVLDAIPHAWAPFMVGLPDIEAAQRRLSQKLHDTKITLSQLPDSAEEAEAYEEPDDTE